MIPLRDARILRFQSAQSGEHDKMHWKNTSRNLSSRISTASWVWTCASAGLRRGCGGCLAPQNDWLRLATSWRRLGGLGFYILLQGTLVMTTICGSSNTNIPPERLVKVEIPRYPGPGRIAYCERCPRQRDLTFELASGI